MAVLRVIGKFIGAGLVFSGLSACMAGGGGGVIGFLPRLSKPEPQLTREVSLFDGAVIVAGPQGYCIDTDSLRTGMGHGFVLLASCETLSGKPGLPVEPAVMTVSVLPNDEAPHEITASELAASAQPAQVLQAVDGENAVLVQLAEGGNAYLPGGSPVYWRGVSTVNGFHTGLAIYAPVGSDVVGDAGRDLLETLAGNMKSRSSSQGTLRSTSNEADLLDTPAAAPAALSASGDTVPVTTGKERKGLGAVFGRLFPKSSG